MKPRVRTHYFDATDDDVLLWKVRRLWELAAALPVEEVPLEDLVCKAWMLGFPTIAVVWFHETPGPDERRPKRRP